MEGKEGLEASSGGGAEGGGGVDAADIVTGD